jgi:hypothetical protein
MNNQELRLQELHQAKSLGMKIEVEILGGNRCLQSKRLNGKKYTFEAILKTNILPYAKCTRDGGCNCCYIFNPLRDITGKLIPKKYK